MRTVIVLALSLLVVSCYRTHYVNFSSANPDRAPQVEPVRRGGWQNFFVFGWVPGERLIDARKQCGGADNVDSVQTRQTFVQGLLAAVTTVYITIYTPWNGAVYCKQPPK